jgi:hypothetical protein
LNSSLAIKFLEYPILLARFPPRDLRHGPLKHKTKAAQP